MDDKGAKQREQNTAIISYYKSARERGSAKIVGQSSVKGRMLVDQQ
jgi:hypothetical protein